MGDSPEPTANADKHRWTGRLLIATAAILWSTSGLFAKAPIFDTWPKAFRGELLVFWRALFASFALVWFVRKVSWSWRMLPMVFAFAAMNWFFLTAMVWTEASIAIWLQNTAPVWVFLGSVWWLKEKISFRDWRLLGLAGIGVAIILASQASLGSWRGVALGLLAGFSYAVVILSLRQLRAFDAAWLVFLNHFATAVVFLPSLLYHGVYPQGEQWIFLALFGIFQMGIPYVLFARGLQSLAGHEASGIGLIEPILVPVWVFLVWRNYPDYQPPTLLTLLGAAFILAGLASRYMGIRGTRSNSFVADENDAHRDP